MLLRLRVALPDRPGSLGQVARTLGAIGADIVQVVVLERAGGRAVDDFAVELPSAAALGRIHPALEAVPGVRVEGAWRGGGLPEQGAGREAAIVGQVAANPAVGLSTLVDAAPGVLGADWAAAISLGTGWAGGSATPNGVVTRRHTSMTGHHTNVTTHCTSWLAPAELPVADVAPMRLRAVTAADGTHLAVAPFPGDGLALVVGRGGPAGDAGQPAGGPGGSPGWPGGSPGWPGGSPGWPGGSAGGSGGPPFHRWELERLAQLVDAVTVVLGPRLAVPAMASAAGAR